MQAYYNAGSAALVLILIAALVGVFFWWRRRRGVAGGRLRGLPVDSTPEESIPLNATLHDEPNDGGFRTRKGKERAGTLPDNEAIFDVGDDEDDEGRSPARR